MEKIRSKFILILTAVILVTGLGTKYLLTNVLTQFAFKGYTLIPIFFFIMGLAWIFILTNTSKDDGKKLINKYMMMRVVKILMSLTFVLIYWLANKPEIKNFATVFIVFYMIYLLFETFVYIQIEKRMKKERAINKDITNEKR